MSKRTQTKPKAKTIAPTSVRGKKAQRTPAEIVKALQAKMARVKKRAERMSPEQQLADLQKKVDSVNARHASKAVRSTDGGKKFVFAMHAIRKAIQVQGKRDDAEMKVALKQAQAIVVEYAQEVGIVPKPAKEEGKEAK